jgi:hypothetical protein
LLQRSYLARWLQEATPHSGDRDRSVPKAPMRAMSSPGHYSTSAIIRRVPKASRDVYQMIWAPAVKACLSIFAVDASIEL